MHTVCRLHHPGLHLQWGGQNVLHPGCHVLERTPGVRLPCKTVFFAQQFKSTNLIDLKIESQAWRTVFLPLVDPAFCNFSSAPPSTDRFPLLLAPVESPGGRRTVRDCQMQPCELITPPMHFLLFPFFLLVFSPFEFGFQYLRSAKSQH